MKPDKTLRKFEQTLGAWRERLGPRSDEDFAKPPADGGWTIGQVCNHISAASDMMLRGAEACAQGAGEKKGFSPMPAFMTFIGSFPPGRFKVPPALKELANPSPISKAQAIERLDAIENKVRALQESVAAAPKDIKSKHPAAGWLNASQWYQITEMHMRHHLRQLGRIEKSLG
jgi:hypothetical protein